MRPLEQYFLATALLTESREIYERSVMIRPIPDLYHYTTFEGCSGILRTRTIWATECRCLNDTSELSYSEALIRESVQEAAGSCSPAVRDFLLKFSYAVQYMAGRMRIDIASFSERGDSPSQWNAYARKGVSLGLSGAALEALPNCFIVKVTYDPAVQRQLVDDTLALHIPLIEEAFRAKDRHRVILVSGLLATQLSLYASAFKNPSFEDEREWRMITGATPESLRVRHTAGFEQPYIELSLEVEIGAGIPLLSVRHSPYLDPDTGLKNVDAVLREFGCDPRMACGSQVPLRLPTGTGKQFVVCVRNKGYEESLELRKIYEVLDDPEAAADGLLRVIDEDEDYLYPALWFRTIQLPQDVEAAFTELTAS